MPYPFTSIYFDDPIEPLRAIDVFMPKKVSRNAALFFVHGGGWRAGSRSGYHAIMRAFNAEGFICAGTDYRLSGVTLIDQLTDIRHGYDVFVSELKRMNIAPCIITYGGSAGAHLAALLSFAKPGACGESLSFRGYSPVNAWTPPAATMLSAFTPFFTPWDDIFPGIWASMQDIAGASFADDPARYERFSPIMYVGADTPPVFVSHAQNEHMFPYENLMRFEEKMTSFGKHVEIRTYANTEHGFFYDVTRRQQKEVFHDMLGYIGGLS
ncbi:MAG: alpha/beta hydrolase [Spirochaetota bacterium]